MYIWNRFKYIEIIVAFKVNSWYIIRIFRTQLNLEPFSKSYLLLQFSSGRASSVVVVLLGCTTIPGGYDDITILARSLLKFMTHF